MQAAIIRGGRLVGVCLLILLLVACAGGSRRGGYYLDDGPDANPPGNLDAIPDAVPKLEAFTPSTSKPYVVFGKTYTPDISGVPYKAQGRASWYGRKFHGNSTANGERYDLYKMTAAHPTLPIPSSVRVTRPSNGKSVVLRVNDRGPFLNDRVIDLSYVAAYKLGMLGPGSAEVIVERITPDQIRNWQTAPAPSNLAGEISAPRPSGAAPPSSTPASSTIQRPTELAASAGIATLPPATETETAAAPAPARRSSEPTPLPAPPEAPGPTASTPAAPGSMFLQLGAFSDASKAHSLAERVSSQIPSGLNAAVKVDQNANNLYRVRIGPFASREAAVQAVSPVQNSTGVAPSLSPP